MMELLFMAGAFYGTFGIIACWVLVRYFLGKLTAELKNT